MADSGDLFTNPLHPYTEALLSAIPNPDPDLRRRRTILQGEVASPSNPPSGCHFHPRCRFATEMCKQEVPEWREYTPGHFASCHRVTELDLTGVNYAA
jgi:peptide/nickel transport system ATP-binding protein